MLDSISPAFYKNTEWSNPNSLASVYGVSPENSFSSIMNSNKFGIKENSKKDFSTAASGSGRGVDIMGINASINSVFNMFHAAPKSPVAALATVAAVILAVVDASVAVPSCAAVDYSSSSSVSTVCELRIPSRYVC